MNTSLKKNPKISKPQNTSTSKSKNPEINSNQSNRERQRTNIKPVQLFINYTVKLYFR